MTARLAAAAALLLASPAVAGIVTVIPNAPSLAAPDAPPTFPVYFTNEGTTSELHTPPSTLPVDDGKSAMAFIAEDAVPATLAPGMFRKVEYSLRPVADTQTAAPGTPSIIVEPVNAATARDSGRGLLAHISGYRPVYALFGAQPSNAKLQLSFKYQFFDENGLLGKRDRWLSGLHFGFTQTLFWDLSQPSAPFRDIVFSPELMYLAQSRRAATAGRPAFAVQAGVRHESNGRDGDDSRSLNTVYFEPAITLALGDDWTASAAPRAWFYVGGKEGNESIERFRGYSNLRLGAGQTDGIYLAANLRGFVGNGRGSTEFDLSYPLNRLVDNLNLYLHSQLFTGFGESLIDFDRKKTALRLGVSIVR